VHQIVAESNKKVYTWSPCK